MSPGRTLSRDRIVGLLWPERDEAHARRLLSLALHQLRGALGADAIRTVGVNLALDEGLVCGSDLAIDDLPPAVCSGA